MKRGMRGSKVVAVLLVVTGVAAADASVSLGTPKVTSGYDRAALVAAVEELSSELSSCYRGSVGSYAASVTFTIAGNGTVTSATVTGLDKQARACLADLFKAQTLPRPKTGKPVRVTYPMTFTRVNALVQGSNGFRSLSGGQATGKDVASKTGWAQRQKPGPTLSLGRAKVTGELDRALIREAIKVASKDYMRCYERQLAINPALSGTLTVEFTIGGDGRVSAATASGLGSQDVESCWAAVIKSIEFPKPKRGTVSVVYPFTVRPLAQ